MKALTPLGILVALVLAATTVAAAPTNLVHGDRIEGTLLQTDDEVGFTFDALAGSEVKISVKATNGSGLEPEFLLADSRMVPVELSPRYKHTAGSKKAKLKTFELLITGQYTLVVRGLQGTTGTFLLKFKIEHPRKFKSTGLIEFSFATSLVRFSAFDDSLLTFKVKGRSGFVPRISTLLQPDVREVVVTGVTYDGTHYELECDSSRGVEIETTGVPR